MALSAGRCSMPDLIISATVSIVVPFHNEEGNVTELYSRLYAVMEKTGWGYEFIFVDDGSTDRTYKLLKELAVIDQRISIVRLRRNFVRRQRSQPDLRIATFNT
jgi:glycosyltransferase involved in cell wall biosynthesis